MDKRMTEGRWQFYEGYADAIRKDSERDRLTCETAFLECFDELKASREFEAFLRGNGATEIIPLKNGGWEIYIDGGRTETTNFEVPTLHAATPASRKNSLRLIRSRSICAIKDYIFGAFMSITDKNIKEIKGRTEEMGGMNVRSLAIGRIPIGH